MIHLIWYAREACNELAGSHSKIWSALYHISSKKLKNNNNNLICMKFYPTQFNPLSCERGTLFSRLFFIDKSYTYPLDPFPSNWAFRSTCSLLSCLVHKLSTYISIFKHFIIQPHNGKPLAESSIILEYIDQTWNHAPRFPPEDSYKRAQIQFWAGFIQQQVKPLVI